MCIWRKKENYPESRSKHNDLSSRLYPRLSINMDWHLTHQSDAQMSSLCNAYPISHASMDLPHMHHTSHTHNFKVAIIMCWMIELFISFRTPWVGS